MKPKNISYVNTKINIHIICNINNVEGETYLQKKWKNQKLILLLKYVFSSCSLLLNSANVVKGI